MDLEKWIEEWDSQTSLGAKLRYPRMEIISVAFIGIAMGVSLWITRHYGFSKKKSLWDIQICHNVLSLIEETKWRRQVDEGLSTAKHPSWERVAHCDFYLMILFVLDNMNSIMYPGTKRSKNSSHCPMVVRRLYEKPTPQCCSWKKKVNK